MDLTATEIKKLVGEYAANLVMPGMKLGLGTGSTVFYLLKELEMRKKQGLDFSFVPTSRQTADIAAETNMIPIEINEVEQLDLCIDGADEIDPQGNLIKGGGGALLQEKIVAAASKKLVIIADHQKLVNRLGKFPLPVEVITFGYMQVLKKLQASGLCKSVSIRLKDGKPFITDHQHYILDCNYETILDYSLLNTSLHEIPGVVETGLFIRMASQAIIGYADGHIKTINFTS